MSAASAPLGTVSPVLGVSHPLYATYRPIWQKLLDVFEGAGGFLSDVKPYLIAHPREFLDHSIPQYADDNQTITGYTVNLSPSNPSPKLLERRKLARYENIAETLVGQLRAALFRVGAVRTFSDEAPVPQIGKRPIEQFHADADGLGTSWDELLRQAWCPAAVFGHVFLYLDDASEDDAREVPVARLYTPLDVPDWLMDEKGRVTQIKFLEAGPRESFRTPVTNAARNVRVRVVTEDGWSLQTVGGKVIEAGFHSFGSLPVAVLYAKRRAITPFIGKSVLGDPMNFIDLYNLVSEVRELLRKQTFSILNVPVGDNGSIEREQGLIGRQSGTGNILFTSQPADYISAEGSNVEVYHAHIDRLIRTIYRLAVLPWESDSRDAESGDSRRIKREDLNQQLAGFADELQRVDERVTDLIYQATYGAAWDRWRERDGLKNRWPDTFEVTPLEELLKQFTDAIRLELGETATKEAKKRAVRAALPDLTPQMLALIDDEIAASEVLTEADRRQQQLDASIKRFAGVAGG